MKEALHIDIRFTDLETDRILDHISNIKNANCDVYVWDDYHAWFSHSTGKEILSKIRTCSDNKMYLVCNGNQGLPKNYLGFEVIDLPYPLIHYMHRWRSLNIEFQKQPSALTGKFLCLTGKPQGYHRTGLIFSLWNNNLLGQSLYSYFGNTKEFRDVCSQYIPTNFVADFFDQVKNTSPDDIITKNTGHQSIHHNGDYDVSLYTSTKFSVISETHTWEGPPFHVTEKTWRTILNCHPFLLVGQNGMIKYLESLGINCYRPFWVEPYEAKKGLTWDNDNNQKLVNNIKHWLNMQEEEWKKVRDIARLNQKKCLELHATWSKMYDDMIAKTSSQHNRRFIEKRRSPWAHGKD